MLYLKAESLFLFANAYFLSFILREFVIALYLTTSIRIKQANYLTFGGLLSRNAGDFFGSVSVGVDFCEYLSVYQVFKFQVLVK